MKIRYLSAFSAPLVDSHLRLARIEKPYSDEIIVKLVYRPDDLNRI